MNLDLDSNIRSELIKNWKLTNDINDIYPKLFGRIPDYCRNNSKECKPLCGKCRDIRKEEENYKKLTKERDESDKILNAKYGTRGKWASINVDGYESNAIGNITL